MLERLKRRLSPTSDVNEGLLADLIDDAEAFVKGYTGRKTRPVDLDGVVVEIAAASYRQLGIEGESSHSEGGISSVIDTLPAARKAMLDRYRVAKVG